VQSATQPTNPPEPLARQISTEAVVGSPSRQNAPISKRLDSTAVPSATAAAYEGQVNERKERLNAEMNPANIPERVKRRMEQLESMRAKVKAQMDKLSAGTGESQKSILDDLRKEGFTVSLEKEDAAAAKELEMLKAGKYLDIFGDLYYTTLISPLEDSIGLSKAQSWNHLGLQSLNQFIINYNINTALGDDLGRTLEIFLQVFGADKEGTAAAAAAEPAQENGGIPASTPPPNNSNATTASSATTTTTPATTPATTSSGPDGKLACTMDELRYLIPPLRHRMLTLRSQARLFTLNAGANSRALTPNAHHYLDVAERIGVFLASAVKKCGNAWNNMGAAKATAAPEPTPQSIISEDLMAKINEIYAYIKRMEDAEAAATPEPSKADLTREYLMQRFLDYQMLREDARSWLNKKLLKAAVAARFDALEAQVAAANPDVVAQLGEIEEKLNVLMETTPTINGLDSAIDGIHIEIERATNYLSANIRDEIRNGVNAIIGNVQDALEAHVERTEELASATQNLIAAQGRDITTSIDAINEQLAELEAQRAANDAEIRRLTAEKGGLLADIERARDNNQQLEETNQELSARLTKIEAALAQAAADNAVLIAELEAARAENAAAIARLTEQLNTLTAQKDAAEAAARAATEAAEAEAATAQTAAEAAQAEAEAARAAAETARAERDAAAQNAEAARAAANERVAAAETALTAAQARVAELNIQIARLQAKLAEQTDSHAAALAEIAGELQSDTTKDEIIQSIQTLQRELTSLRTELDTTQANLVAANDQIRDLNTKLTDAQTENEHLQREITGLKDDLTAASSTGSDAARALVAAKGELAKKDAELDALRKQLADCSGAVARLEGELAAAKASGDQTAVALNIQLEAAQAEQASVQKELDNARRDKDALNERIISLTTDNATKQAKIAELEASLNAKTGELATATSKIARLSALGRRADITPDELAAIRADKAKAEAAAATTEGERARLTSELEALRADITALNTNPQELQQLRSIKQTIDSLVAYFNEIEIRKSTGSGDIYKIAEELYAIFKGKYLQPANGVSISDDYYTFTSGGSVLNKLELGLYKTALLIGVLSGDKGLVVASNSPRYYAYATFEDDYIMIFKLLIALSNRKLIKSQQFDQIVKNMFFTIVRNTRYASFFKGATPQAVKDTEKRLENKGIFSVDRPTAITRENPGYIKSL
jgi:chromosome segregation ATPase